MTTPVEPASTPEDVPVPEAAPTPGPTDAEIRDLAAQLAAPALSFDPATIRKGVVTGVAVGNASTAPTISVTISGDTTTVIDGVRLAADYSPIIGDTTMLFKQGANLFAAFKIAEAGSITASSDVGGFVQATLGSGFTHNGNSQGNLMYRRVLEDGAWKVQWKGGVSISGTQTAVCTVGSDFLPTGKRTLTAAREQGSGSNVITVDFTTGGAVTLVGNTTAPDASASSSSGSTTGTAGGQSTSSASPYTSNVDPLDNTTAGGADGHSHGVVGAHYHVVDSHWHGNGNHAHTMGSVSVSVTVSVGAPAWVSFNGLEYFL